MAEKFTTGFVNSLMEQFIEAFANGVLAIYSGTQPASRGGHGDGGVRP